MTTTRSLIETATDISPGDDATLSIGPHEFGVTVDDAARVPFTFDTTAADNPASQVRQGQIELLLVADVADAGEMLKHYATILGDDLDVMQAAETIADLENEYGTTPGVHVIDFDGGDLDTVFPDAALDDHRTILLRLPRAPELPLVPEDWPKVWAGKLDGGAIISGATVELASSPRDTPEARP